MPDAVSERLREQERMLAVARDYVERLRRVVRLRSAVVAGSVARGDFNVWSDIDVVVIAEGLPDRAPDRAALLSADAPPRVQPVGYTPAEWRAALERGDRLATEAATRGVLLAGELEPLSPPSASRRS